MASTIFLGYGKKVRKVCWTEVEIVSHTITVTYLFFCWGMESQRVARPVHSIYIAIGNEGTSVRNGVRIISCTGQALLDTCSQVSAIYTLYCSFFWLYIQKIMLVGILSVIWWMSYLLLPWYSQAVRNDSRIPSR